MSDAEQLDLTGSSTPYTGRRATPRRPLARQDAPEEPWRTGRAVRVWTIDVARAQAALARMEARTT